MCPDDYDEIVGENITECVRSADLEERLQNNFVLIKECSTCELG